MYDICPIQRGDPADKLIDTVSQELAREGVMDIKCYRVALDIVLAVWDACRASDPLEGVLRLKVNHYKQDVNDAVNHPNNRVKCAAKRRLKSDYYETDVIERTAFLGRSQQLVERAAANLQAQINREEYSFDT